MNSYRIVIGLVIAIVLLLILKLINIIPQSLYVYSITSISIVGIMVCWVEFLKHSIKKKKYVYVSFTFKDMERANLLAENIKDFPVIKGSTDVEGGVNTDKVVSKYIKNSFICFVLLGDKVGAAQKYEISEMQKMRKRIVPVLITPSSKIPQNLSNIKAVLFDDFMKVPYKPLD